MGTDIERVEAKNQKSKGKISCIFCSALCVLCSVLFLMAGCGGGGQSIDALFAAANSQLASAQKAGAEQLAKSEFEEASALLAESEIAMGTRDQEAQSFTKKAHIKARLAEALARQSKAESEAVQLEADLEKASAEASSVRLERRAAESELDQGSPD